MPTAQDIEDAAAGWSAAEDFIEECHRLELAARAALIAPFRPDPFEGCALFSSARGYYPAANGNGYHPRRGHGALFQRYESILNRFGLRASAEDSSKTQHVIFPADATPPPARVRDAPLEIDRRFGIHDGHRVVPTCPHPREVPPWTWDDDLVRSFIRHRCPGAFPGETVRRPTRSAQRRAHRKAAVLAAVLYLWFRALLPAESIADELRLDVGQILQVAGDVREHGAKFLAGTCGCRSRSAQARTTAPETAPKPLLATPEPA